MKDRISPQLPLGLSLRDEATFENFIPGANIEIRDLLKQAASGNKRYDVIYLCGNRGLGSSHLLQACCHHAYANGQSSVYLPLRQSESLDPQMLQGLEALSLVCIDDIQAIAGQLVWEEALFHLYNRAMERGCQLIVAANALPKQIGLQLPDLVSRLAWGVVYQLHALADADKLAVLTMRASRRGMSLSDEVGKYLLTHCPRHMGTLMAVLDALDKATLAAQRRLTIPFVKEVLQI